MIKTVNLTAVRGDTFSMEVRMTAADGAAVDLTGYTLMFTVKPLADHAADDSAAVVAVDVTAHTDAAGGLSTVTVPAADTADLLGVYAWDLQSRAPDGTITTLTGGQVEWLADVTRRTVAA